MARKDLTGQVFGDLTVTGYDHTDKKWRAYWKCKCACGNECIVRGSHLTSGAIKSCGCLRKENAAEATRKVKTIHGLHDAPLYNTWSGIKQRCFNPNNPAYKNYGARGITICPAWAKDFKAFYDYASQLEHFNEEGYSLDRIDNDGNYEPGNLRYATKSEQARNRRANCIVEYQGQKVPMAEAAELSEIDYGALQGRYYRGDRGERLFRTVKK